MRLRILGAVVAVAVLLGACATIPPSQNEEKLIELIDRFNTLPAGEFTELASVPFVFGDQVLYSSGDVEAVLARVKASGLVLTPVITGISASVSLAGSQRFDVGVFQDRLPDDAREVLVDSTAGPVTLLVGGESNGLPMLMGIQREDS
jgi:hypothetical protein